MGFGCLTRPERASRCRCGAHPTRFAAAPARPLRGRDVAPMHRPGRPRRAGSPLRPAERIPRRRVLPAWHRRRHDPAGRGIAATLGGASRCGRRLACRRDGGAGFASHAPVHAERILEGLGDDVGVALFAQPLGQGRRFMAQHQGVAFDRTDGGAGQHHLSGSAALTHLVAHRRPQGADRGRGRFGRAGSDLSLASAGLGSGGVGSDGLGSGAGSAAVAGGGGGAGGRNGADRSGLSPTGMDMSSLVSIRSTRCSRADSASLADGSNSRAQITSSSRRGAVAPRISVRPAWTTSA